MFDNQLLTPKYFDVIFLNQTSGHNFLSGKEVFYLGRQQRGEAQRGR